MNSSCETPRASDLANLAGEYLSMGYAGPLPLIDPDLAIRAAGLLESESRRASQWSRLKKFLGKHWSYRLFGNAAHSLLATRNRHADLAEICEIAHSALLRDISLQLVGEQPILWRSQALLQEGKPDTGHALHRDDYTGLVEDMGAQLSCQVALTASSNDNCMIFLPATHKMNHDEVMEKYGLEKIPLSPNDSYGTSRYRQTRIIGNENVVRIVMQPGEAVFFHPQLIHGSASMLRKNPEDTEIFPDLRAAIVFRITSEKNYVTPSAFTQTLPRTDRTIPL